MNIDPLYAATLVCVMAAWMIFAAAFLFRPKPPPAPPGKRLNAAMAGILLVAAGYFTVWFLRRPVSTPLFQAGRPLALALDLLAPVIAFCSAGLVLAAVRALGRQWSMAARLVEGHKLVTTGPYGLVRHPIYTGMLGMMLATGMALSRPLALAIGLPLGVIGTLIRIHFEEKLLREAFSGEFDDYKKRVQALIPWIL